MAIINTIDARPGWPRIVSITFFWRLSQRAVLTSGTMARMGTSGRSRDARITEDPDSDTTTMHLAFMVRTMDTADLISASEKVPSEEAASGERLSHLGSFSTREITCGLAEPRLVLRGMGGRG